MKYFILAVLFFTSLAHAGFDPLRSNQDWSVDLANSCVFQATKHTALGSTTCDPDHQLSIITNGSDGALRLDSYTTPSTHEGVIEILHKAGGPGTSAIRYTGDQNGYASTNFINATISLTGMAVSDIAAPDLRIIDTANSTGGFASGINVQKQGSGSAQVAAVIAGTGVFPVVTLTGALGAGPEKAWTETVGPTYTDVTTNFGSASSDSTLFLLDNDCVYVGNAATYYEIQVALATPSSANITPVFSYSTASGFTTFAPADGTSGFTRSGNINFDKQTLINAGWASRSVNGVSKYYIRICRTENTVVTAPVEDTIFLADGTVNQWDNSGRITIQQITTNGAQNNNFGGRVHMTANFNSHGTCDSSGVGLLEMYDNGANKISLCVCEKTGAASYAWGSVTAGGSC
jgi:hypothetical protein